MCSTRASIHLLHKFQEAHQQSQEKDIEILNY